MPNPNWTGVSESMARQILHQGETFMQAQLQTAITQDQRAVTAASVFVAVAVALVGGSLAYWDKQADLPMLIGGVVAASAFTIAGIICFWSARPISFFFPGNYPQQWWSENKRTLAVVIGEETENYQVRIEKNARCLDANGRAMRVGVIVALAAAPAAFIAWLISAFWVSALNTRRRPS